MMLNVSGHAGLGGPPLVRLLARLGQADVRAAAHSLPESLGQWLGWVDAIALAAALKPAQQPHGRDLADVIARESTACDRVRDTLSRAIRTHALLMEQPPAARRGSVPLRTRSPGESPQPQPQPDYAAYRDCCLLLQRRMASAIHGLRERLRAALSEGGAEMAQLAAIDAVMDQMLTERAESHYAAVPTLLETRFTQLRENAQAHPAADGGEPTLPDRPQPAWLANFRADMRQVLLAELDIRLQPVTGLLAALRDAAPVP